MEWIFKISNVIPSSPLLISSWWFLSNYTILSGRIWVCELWGHFLIWLRTHIKIIFSTYQDFCELRGDGVCLSALESDNSYFFYYWIMQLCNRRSCHRNKTSWGFKVNCLFYNIWHGMKEEGLSVTDITVSNIAMIV